MDMETLASWGIAVVVGLGVAAVFVPIVRRLADHAGLLAQEKQANEEKEDS
jgi:hypothetical protein